MSFADIPLFSMLQQKMSFLTDRQAVLARNIANSSTPGYVPQDLRANDFAIALSQSANAGGLNVTSARHIQPRGASAMNYRSLAAPDSQSSPDGNAVVVEQQMMKVAETQMQYAEASGLYKKMTAMWRTALSSPRG